MRCRCGAEIEAVNDTGKKMLIGCPECGHLYELSPLGAPTDLPETIVEVQRPVEYESKVIATATIVGTVEELKFKEQDRLWNMLGINRVT